MEQAKSVEAVFLEYGLLGALLIVMFFVARYLYIESKNDAAVWKEMAVSSQKSFIDISIEQNKTNQRLIEIRQKDVEQHKEFQDGMVRKLEDLPERIIKEMKYLEMQRNQTKHTTPSP